MKERSYTQMIAIQGVNPQDTAQQFNKAMVELYKKQPTYQMVDSNLFYIFYTECSFEAESKADEYELRGSTSLCQDCQFFHQHKTKLGKTDNRAKFGTCTLHNKATSKGNRACSSFYEEMEKREEVRFAKNHKYESATSAAL